MSSKRPNENSNEYRPYAGLHHAFVITTIKPRLHVACSLNTNIRLGGYNNSVT